MNKFLLPASALLALPIAVEAWAAVGPAPYEQSTHSVLAREAAARSQNLARFLQDLDLEQEAFPTTFVNWANRAGGVGLGSTDARAMIVAGAVLEDGIAGSPFSSSRPRNHFYDPTTGGPGIPGGSWAQAASPDWGIDGPSNQYSWERGLDALEQGLTASTPEGRKQGLTDALLSLGAVTHLLQDCYQPSHVRGDAHVCNHLDDTLIGEIIGDLTGCAMIEFAGSDVVNGAQVSPSIRQRFGDFAPTPRATVREYFDSSAQWVNTNFFSDDTIFREYTAPSASGTSVQTCPGNAFADYVVSNTVTVQFQSVRLAAARNTFLCGIAADQGLGGILVQDCYSLLDHDCNTVVQNYPGAVLVDNMKALLPRAIAQSEALIDHFFRGRLQVSFDDQGRLVVQNSASSEHGVLQSGFLRVYYEDPDGVRTEVADPDTGLVSPIPLGGPLGLGQELTLPGDAAAFLSAQPGDGDKRLVVVFDGVLGQGGERGLAAGRVSITSEASLLLVFDVSGSISVSDLDQAKAAALSLIPILSGGQGNRASVHAFSFGASIVADFTDDLDLIESSIGGLSPGGSTALFDAVVLAGTECSQEASDFPSPERKVVAIIFTDGQRNSSQASIVDAAAAISRPGHPEIDEVFLVFVGSGSSSGQLDDLAALADRPSFTVANFEDLKTTFLNLLQ